MNKKILCVIIVILFGSAAAQAAVFTVNRVLDGSDINPGDGICETGVGNNCTLRAAIEEANAFPGTDRIEFDITGGGAVKIITPGTLYPSITQPVTIDGTSQPGYAGTPLVEIVGTNVVAGASGLDITAGNTIVQGLAINRFPFYGILLRTNGSNQILTCYLGTDAATGSVDLGNGIAGLAVESADNNISNNVISGNNTGGILITGANNNVTANYVGTNAAGNAALGNTDSGITINSIGNVIGSTNPVLRNVISANGDNLGTVGGIILNAGGNTIIGNYIGTDASGTADLGNNGNGIQLRTGAVDNQIGGTFAGEANTIAFNNYGVGVSSNAATGNRIRANLIFSNDDLGISLSFTGTVTPNDAGDADTGANNLQNYPAVSRAANSGGATIVTAALNSTPTTSFNIDFYSNGACDASGYGEGQNFIGTKFVTTDASGNVSFTFSPGALVPLGRFVTATATRAAAPFETSEFSACEPVVNGNLYEVNTTADAGAGSLRQAILDTNTAPGLDKITFNIAGAGVRTISLLSALPNITDAVIIDGETQPGYNGQPLIELNGASAGAGVSGLNVTGGNSTIRALIINRFNGSGIGLSFGGGGNTVTGCYIGTGASGSTDFGNAQSGIVIASAPNNRIGGAGFSGRNVIAGNDLYGIFIVSAPSTGNIITNNYIGTNATATTAIANNIGVFINAGANNNQIGGGNVISGNATAGVFIVGDAGAAGANSIVGNFIGTNSGGTTALGNGGAGVSINDSANNQIGGANAARRNIISGNLAAGLSGGVNISGALSIGNQIRGNYIGTGANGASNVGNAAYGIRINDASNNQVGGTTVDEGNTIAFNGNAGIFVFQIGGTAVGNTVNGNSIFSNVGIGIDLGSDGVTANDGGDADAGENNRQNYPVITSASPGGTRVAGTLNSTPNTQFRIEFFNSPSADASGYGEGQFAVGSLVVTTNGAGNAAFNQLFVYSSPLNSFVSATATNLTTGDTSEFSLAKEVLAATAAAASIGGRAINQAEHPIAGVRIWLIEPKGNVRLARTNQFGYYNFANVPSGETYILTASDKRFRFGSQIVTVNASLDDINFTALPVKF